MGWVRGAGPGLLRTWPVGEELQAAPYHFRERPSQKVGRERQEEGAPERGLAGSSIRKGRWRGRRKEAVAELGWVQGSHLCRGSVSLRRPFALFISGGCPGWWSGLAGD